MQDTHKPREVVLIRHAQSTWNAEHRFTGWADPPLTLNGKQEAVEAGVLLRGQGYTFDTVYSSVLQRATQTADIVLETLANPPVTVTQDWRLNERHYGDLQGRNKDDMAAEVGKEQVFRWRRGYRDFPPALSEDDTRHPKNDPRYLGIGPLPACENLAQTRERAVAFWQAQVEDNIRAGRKILVSTHGNTLRGLIMALSNMSESDVESFEIPTGVPIIYRFDEQATPLEWHYLKAE